MESETEESRIDTAVKERCSPGGVLHSDGLVDI